MGATNPLTPEEIAEGLDLCKAATPGEWESQHTVVQTGAFYTGIEYRVLAYPFGRYAGPVRICADMLRVGDAAFIARARDILPRVLREFQTAQQRATELEAKVERLLASVRDQVCECHDEYNNRLPTAPCQRCRLLGEAAEAAKEGR